MHSTEDRQERGKGDGRMWEPGTRETAPGGSSQKSIRRREDKGQRRSLGKREMRKGGSERLLQTPSLDAPVTDTLRDIYSPHYCVGQKNAFRGPGGVPQSHC